MYDWLMAFTSRTFAGLACIAFAYPICALAAGESVETTSGPSDVLFEDQWKELDARMDRALAWIATTQEANGSFRGPVLGQPAITGFCVLAYMSRGHVPGQGPYGDQLQWAIDYILSCQRENGIFSGDRHYERSAEGMAPSLTAIYNHAIAGVTLSELYGMTRKESNQEIASAIRQGLELTKKLQDRPKVLEVDEGGWRYIQVKTDFSSDLSVTSWQLMFYRSARNGGFEVESSRIDAAMKFVVACYDKTTGGFRYHPQRTGESASSHAMTSAGILALAHGGKLDSAMARKGGLWMLAHPFQQYGEDRWFHYSLFYAVPAMYMLGREYWARFFPDIVRLLLDQQDAEGHWRAEPGPDAQFGNTYTTALVVTALCAPNQLLPIFQR